MNILFDDLSLYIMRNMLHDIVGYAGITRNFFELLDMSADKKSFLSEDNISLFRSTGDSLCSLLKLFRYAYLDFGEESLPIADYEKDIQDILSSKKIKCSIFCNECHNISSFYGGAFVNIVILIRNCFADGKLDIDIYGASSYKFTFHGNIAEENRILFDQFFHVGNADNLLDVNYDNLQFHVLKKIRSAHDIKILYSVNKDDLTIEVSQ